MNTQEPRSPEELNSTPPTPSRHRLTDGAQDSGSLSRAFAPGQAKAISEAGSIEVIYRQREWTLPIRIIQRVRLSCATTLQ